MHPAWFSKIWVFWDVRLSLGKYFLIVWTTSVFILHCVTEDESTIVLQNVGKYPTTQYNSSEDKSLATLLWKPQTLYWFSVLSIPNDLQDSQCLSFYTWVVSKPILPYVILLRWHIKDVLNVSYIILTFQIKCIFKHQWNGQWRLTIKKELVWPQCCQHL